MTSYVKRKEKLFKELKNKKYRDAYVAENINIGIPFQIKALREQREWTQKEMEERTGMNQARISILEDINYSKFTLSTLKRFASAFDVGLIVRFVPISELVEWELNLSSESLEVLSYDEEPYFKENTIIVQEKEQKTIPYLSIVSNENCVVKSDSSATKHIMNNATSDDDSTYWPLIASK